MIDKSEFILRPGGQYREMATKCNKSCAVATAAGRSSSSAGEGGRKIAVECRPQQRCSASAGGGEQTERTKSKKISRRMSWLT